MAIVDNSSEDIVKRITQRINDFQRSTVTFGEDCEVVMPAARADSILGDDIKHSSAWAALAGAIVGGILAYGPTVLSFIPGPIGVAARVGMFLFDVADTVSGFVSDKSFSERAADSVSQWIESFSPASHGKLIKGSTFLQINNLPAAIATPAEEVLQSVRCDNHSLQEVGEGSETVFIDGTPAARQGDRVVCGAKISTGSPNVFFGSGQALYSPIKPEFNSVQKALLVAVEFVIPPTALFSKGIGKAITQAEENL